MLADSSTGSGLCLLHGRVFLRVGYTSWQSVEELFLPVKAHTSLATLLLSSLSPLKSKSAVPQHLRLVPQPHHRSI
jgi:hypothetical protein